MKESDLYLPSGYLDMDRIISISNTFCFIIGGRGTGKTYGALQYALERHVKFIYMRRTQTQVDVIKSNDMNPFKSVADDVITKSINKSLTGVYRCDPDEDINKPIGPALGYIVALSTISNLRGFDASDVDLIIFDEFKGEAHEKLIKDEGVAFFNAYETINRNRELNGQPPVKALMLANSNSLDSALLATFNLIMPYQQMFINGEVIREYPDRHVTLVLLPMTEISKKKAMTALYAAASSAYTDMAIANKFVNDDLSNIETRDLNKCTPLCRVGEIWIYKVKGTREYYVSHHGHGTFKVQYDVTDSQLKAFRRKYYYVWLAELNQRIYYESYVERLLLDRYLKPKI